VSSAPEPRAAPARPLLVLLQGAEAEAAVRAIEGLCGAGTVDVLHPPVRGAGFLAAGGEEAARLDAWWESAGAGPGRPVVLVAHEEGLPRWIPGLDADFVVSVPDHETETLYEGQPNVRCCAGGDTSSLVELALPDLAVLPAPPDPFALLSLAEPVPPPALDGSSPPSGTARRLSRRDLLGPPGRASWPAGGPAVRGLLRRLRGGGRVRVGDGLGQAVLAAKPLLVAVVSRKGGVGKTACAAAIAAILGEALDPFGHTAALVDANLGNPDAWGRLEIRGGCPTVRETIARLAAGRDPRSPAWSQTPALAVYPESREAGDGYTPAEVQRLATHLRLRHAAVVVDLPNRLPAFSSAEASVAAGWIGESAVVVIPTTADPTALLGAVEYLATESLRGRRAVVPYIVPRLREIREAPEVRQMLDRIRSAGAAIVDVPDDDRATLALIRRTAITEAGGDLRQAYVELSARVVEAAAGQVRT
jgi:MinD-like ATPase involved in chromosome partitioning or flagellar assembly